MDCFNDLCLVSQRDGKSFQLSEMTLIGREACDLLINSKSIDKKHAVIYYNQEDNHYTIKDLNSTFGTFINGKKIPEQSAISLNPNDTLRFGFEPENFQIRRLSTNNNKDSPTSSPLIDSYPLSPNAMNNNFTNPSMTAYNKEKSFNELSNNSATSKTLNGTKTTTNTSPSLHSGSNNTSKITATSSPSRAALDDDDDLFSSLPSHLVSNDSMEPICSPGDNNNRKSGTPNSREANNNMSNGYNNESFTSSPSPDERESVSLPPLNAMAFTIPLDESEVKRKNKTFSIKDAIRKFAPPKPDTIEKQRPPKSRSSDSEKSPSKTVKEKVKKESKSKPSKETDSHVSDSASYLIQRMLNDESQQLHRSESLDNDDREKSSLHRTDSKRKPSKESKNAKRSQSISGCNGEKDSGVCDDKSESGTYTLDKNDPVVEEARRRIDQVFGVPTAKSDRLFPSSSSLDKMTSSLASFSALKKLLSSSKTDDNLSNARPSSAPKRQQISDNKLPLVSSTFIRSRANLSCPSSNPGSDSESNSYPLVKPSRKPVSSDTDNHHSNDPYSLWSRRNSMERNTVRQRTSSFTKKASSPVPSSSTRKLKDPSSSTSGSNNPPKGIIGNLKNGSDLDSGDYDDNISLKSDNDGASSASTEPSSGSGNCKSSDGNAANSSMRFNRAFALRRAKLGMDTLGIPLNLTAERQARASSILESRSNPRSTPSPTFNRNDGGRFSLRLQNNINSGRKPPVPNRNHWSRQSSGSGSGSGVDRPKPVNQASKLRTLSTSSDTENSARYRSPAQSPARVAKPVPLQKSSSFHDSKDNSGSASGRRESSSSNNYRGMSAFQVSKRFFSTKPHQMVYRDNSLGSSSVRNSTSTTVPSSDRLTDRKDMNESLNDSKLSCTTSTTTTTSSTIGSNRSTACNGEVKSANTKELSALDKLVVSAILQLSHKLRYNLRIILEKERIKYSLGSEARLMIEELLPQVAVQEKRISEDGDLSKDLSNILKNLKKVEQSFELVTLLFSNGNTNPHSNLSSRGNNDFYGDTSVSCSDFQDEY